jgi:hypothetical protein
MKETWFNERRNETMKAINKQIEKKERKEILRKNKIGTAERREEE